jgi:hypothetical protein
MAHEISNAVLDFLYITNPSLGKSAADIWHGGCMALAELSRRNCISDLNEVMGVALKALFFEFESASGRDSHSEYVKDAACFVLWGIARTFSCSQILQCREKKNLSRICAIALFDAKINVRRAASACLQELVGRVGESVISSGLLLLSLIDYFSLSNLRYCYETLSHQVLSLDESYRESMLSLLMNQKIYNWNRDIRLLSASTAALISPIERQDMILSELVARASKFNMSSHQEHGCLLMIYFLTSKL